MINDAFDAQEPLTYTDIIDTVESEFSKEILSDTLRHVLYRMKGVKPIQGTPMERARVHCDTELIDHFCEDLTCQLDSVPAALVYNLDESGFQKWVDAHATVVIFPSDCPQDEINVPFARSSKRAAILTGIKANGDCLRPLVIIQHKTIEQDLYELGYTPGRCMIVWRESDFMAQALFEDWGREVLFPDLNATRQKLGFPGESHLILDEYTGHASCVFLD